MKRMAETILVTGISGFIAGNLAMTLAQSGATVVGVGRNPPQASSPDIRFIPLDIRNFDAVCRVMQEVRPSTVYHLAACSTLAAAQTEGARAVLETNVGGTWNLLEACRREEVGVAVIASSDKQYGATTPSPYSDQDVTGFGNGGLYELSKAQQDQIARVYSGLYDSPAIRVARLVNIYGPGDLLWSRIVPGTIRRLLTGERPRLTSGSAGEALREYLFVEDCVQALRLLADDAANRGNAPLRRDDGKLARIGFNLPAGYRAAAGEVIAAMRESLRDDFGIEGPEPEILPGPTGVFEPGSQFADTSRFQSLFPDFTPRPFREGLQATIPFYRDYMVGIQL